VFEKEYGSESLSLKVTNILYRVYAWMTLGLALTAVTAYYLSTVPAFYTVFFNNTALTLLLFAVQLGLVAILSIFLLRMRFATAILLFVLYAISLGITLSAIFLVYTKTSIFSAFIVTGSMFGIMSLYGYFTQSDLTTMGNYLFMGLVGLIVAMIVNWFLAAPLLNLLISIAGVFIFTLLTAYDTQRIRRIAENFGPDQETMNKAALFGALTLYLDFLNLFLFVLQFMGNRRN
jgi:uncharacterized protein